MVAGGKKGSYITGCKDWPFVCKTEGKFGRRQGFIIIIIFKCMVCYHYSVITIRRTQINCSGTYKLFNFFHLVSSERAGVHFKGPLYGLIVLLHPAGYIGCIPINFGYSGSEAGNVNIFYGIEYVPETECQEERMIHQIENLLYGAMRYRKVGN